MSEKFEGFSKAAMLYAEYSAVVDEMREQFERNVSAFLDNLRDRITSKLNGGQVGEERAGSGCSWYVLDEYTDKDVPYVWFRTQQSSIVTPGVLELRVYAGEGASESDRKQLASLLADLPQRQWPGICTAGTGTEKCLFSLRVLYGQNDPVAVAVDPMLALLTALDTAYKKKLRVL